jgi:hypothetical protein
MTRGWFIGTTGGPLGVCCTLMQSPVLVWSRAGTALTSTRAAGTSHWMRTQGIGTTPAVNGHPATRY